MLQAYPDKYLFPLFDSACRILGEKGEEESTDQKRTEEELSIGKGLGVISSVALELSGLSGVAQALSPMTLALKKHWKYRKWDGLQKQLHRMSFWNKEQAKSHLTDCFAQDLNNCIEENRKPLLILIDSWELLHGNESAFLAGLSDGLIVKLKGVFWIIAGREKPSDAIFRLCSGNVGSFELTGFDQDQVREYFLKYLPDFEKEHAQLLESSGKINCPYIFSLFVRALAEKERERVLARENEKPVPPGYVYALQKRLPIEDGDSQKLRSGASFGNALLKNDSGNIESLLREWLLNGMTDGQKRVLEVMSVLGKWTTELLRGVILSRALFSKEDFQKAYDSILEAPAWKIMLEQEGGLVIWKRSYRQLFSFASFGNKGLDRVDILEAALDLCMQNFGQALFDEGDYAGMRRMTELAFSYYIEAIPSEKGGDETDFIRLFNRTQPLFSTSDSFTDQPVLLWVGDLMNRLTEKGGGHSAAAGILARHSVELLSVQQELMSVQNEKKKDLEVLTGLELINFAINELKDSVYQGDYVLALIQSLPYIERERDREEYKRRLKNAFALRKEALEKELPDEEECMKAMMRRLMNELSFYGSGSDANGFDADLRKEILQFSRELFEKYAGKLKNRPEPHALHQYIEALSVFEAPRWRFLAKDNSPEAKAEYQDALKRLEKICLIIMDDPKYFAACRTKSNEHWEGEIDDMLDCSRAVGKTDNLCTAFQKAQEASGKAFPEESKILGSFHERCRNMENEMEKHSGRDA